MNQILSEELPQKGRKKHRSSIHSILLVFAIFLMIFGIGLTSTGAYAYYKNLSSNLNDSIVTTANTKPVITIERENASTINIVVTHDKQLANVTYTISGQDSVQINGNGQTEIKEQVELPVGESTITITAEDVEGISSSYESTYTVEQKPTITLEQVEVQIQITTESTINIDYVKYYWDDDEESGETWTINDLKNVTYVDVLEGTHTLNVIAVDIEGNQTTKNQKIIGATKPEVEITTNGTIFKIVATDDEELAKIEITLNSNETITEEISGTEYTTTVDLEEGENKLTVVVYNKNGLYETSRVKYNTEE